MASETRSDVDPQVLEAVQLALSGQVDAARVCFDQLWLSTSPLDLFHRCVLAHYMADLQTDPDKELWWDIQALEAARAAAPESFDDRIPGVSHRAFLPSLHLNLAASHERLGQLDEARQHAQLASRTLDALQPSPLSDMTRAAIERICKKLGVQGC